MKTKIFFFISIIAVTLIGCSKSEKQSGTGPIDKLEVVDLKGEKVQLEYKFAKGDQYKYKLTTITTSEESIQADSTIKSTSSQNVSYVFDVEVIEVDQDKVAEVSINISSINVNASFNGQTIKYDAKAEKSKEDKTKFLEYETIYNNPFRARVNKLGEVIEISRLDKMIDRMNSLQPQKQNLTAEQKSQLSKNLGDMALRPLAQLIFREMPKNSVAKDSAWVKRYPGQISVFQSDNTAKFTVLDFVNYNGDKAAKISADLSVIWSGNKKGEENGVKYSFDDPKAGGDGIIIFNIEEGKLVNAETSTRLEIGVQIQAKDALQKTHKTYRKEITANKNIVELL